MKITQISVFLENRQGRLLEVCSLLGKNQINIRALHIGESPEFGVLRIVVDKPEVAVQVLKAGNFVATLTDIVVVEVADQPGGLAAVLQVINDNGLNIEYMYGFLEKSAAQALLVFRFDDPDKAIKLLTANQVKVVGKNEIAAL